MVYSATTLALAVLETAAHVDDAGLPQNRFVVQIDVPNSLWKHRQTLEVNTLPVAWSAIPAGSASIQIGCAWLQSQSSAILLVPSVIVPEEFVVLINPQHPGATKIKAQAIQPFDYKRLFRT
jgi:RES domain-containing protein